MPYFLLSLLHRTHYIFPILSHIQLPSSIKSTIDEKLNVVAKPSEQNSSNSFTRMSFFDTNITRAEGEHTVFAKANTSDPRRRAVDRSHRRCVNKFSLFRGGINAGYSISTTFRRAIQRLKFSTPCIHFAPLPTVATFSSEENATMVTYDSGANGHYFSKADRKRAGLPILWQSAKHIGVS